MKAIVLLFVVALLGGHTNAAPDCAKPPPMAGLDKCCKIEKTAIDPLVEECRKLVASQPLPAGAVADICVGECIFNKSEILTNGQLDLAKVKVALAKKPDAEYGAQMEKVFTSCAEKTKAILAKMPNANPALTQCKPYSAALMICMGTEVVVNCPAPKWTESPECNTLREYLKACPLPA